MPGSFIADDLSVFFNLSEFASSGVVKTSAGATVATINGIFDHPGDEWNPTTGEIERNDYEFQCKTSDIPAAVVAGYSITIAAMDYEILSILDDGTGVSTITITPINAAEIED